MNIQHTECRIYVACLASYNSGILHGEWIDATDDKDEMQEHINRILRTSPEPNIFVTCPDCEHGSQLEIVLCQTCKGDGEVPSAEEWAIHDHEGLGNLDEYAGLDEVVRRVKLAEVAEAHDIPVGVLIEALENQSKDTDAHMYMQDKYCGKYDSWKAYAEECHEESEIPDWLENHINWKSLGQEMSHSMTGFESGRDLYIFHQN